MIVILTNINSKTQQFFKKYYRCPQNTESTVFWEITCFVAETQPLLACKMTHRAQLYKNKYTEAKNKKD